MTIKVLEAFAGIGTQRMALKKAGIDFEVVAISETDKFALKSYEAIHGPINNLGDIRKIKAEQVPDHDFFTYSFPCQNLSRAGGMEGLKKGSETKSSLVWECEKIIEAKKPKFLLMENVSTLVSKRCIKDFEEWLCVLQEKGYSNYWKILKADDYGIPQKRARVFCVSILDDDQGFSFPDKIELNISLKDFLEEEVDEKYYLDDDILKNIIFDKAEPKDSGAVYIKNATKQGFLEARPGDGIDVSFPNSTTRRGRVQKEKIQTLTTKHIKTTLVSDNSSQGGGEAQKTNSLGILEADGNFR